MKTSIKKSDDELKKLYNVKKVLRGYNGETDLSNTLLIADNVQLPDNQITSLEEFVFNGEYLNLGINKIQTLEGFTFNGKELDLDLGNSNIIS